MDTRGSIPCTRHLRGFSLPQASSETAEQRNPDKALLRETVLALREQGMSYRQIAREVGIHWTRVGQILR
ncbi:MAG: hypothetical protein L6Q98_24320 [Anaerolineae bacterium]|nr:hypothetical protein [Anaerolineae bacterium]NUQ06865.1 helix-turn-helix domain-containing protein [Anaerolineae bacterium]